MFATLGRMKTTLWGESETRERKKPESHLKKLEEKNHAKVVDLKINEVVYNQANADHRNFIIAKMAEYKVELQKMQDSYSSLKHAGFGLVSIIFVSLSTAGLALIAYIALGKHKNLLQFRDNYLAFQKKQNELLEIYRWIFANGPQPTADHNVIQLVKLLAPNVTETNDIVPFTFKLSPEAVTPQFFHALKGTVHEVPEIVLLLIPGQSVMTEEEKKPVPGMVESVKNTLAGYVPEKIKASTNSVLNSSLFHRLTNDVSQVMYGTDSAANKAQEVKQTDAVFRNKPM